MRKDNVLPLPVLAAPRTSLPFKASGRLFACMSVMVVNEAFLSPLRVLSDSGSSLNSSKVVLTS